MADPLGGQPWTSLGLAQATGGATVFGLQVQEVAPSPGASPQPVVLAAVGVATGGSCVGQCGLWRKVGTSAWSQVSTAAMSQTQGGSHASFAWPATSGVVYLFDPATGLWRSLDSGATWSEIWARPFNHDMTGYIATPPGATGVVYVSLGTLGVYRLTGADTGVSVGNGIMATAVGSFVGAGPLATSTDGIVWLAQVAPYGTGLWRSSDGGSTWTSVDDAVYRNLADFPTGVAVGPTGQILVATRGDGVVSSG